MNLTHLSASPSPPTCAASGRRALAHAAGLHRTYVGQVECGKRNVSIDNIERLARALGLDPVELMRG